MTEIEIKTTGLSWEKYLQICRIQRASKRIKGFAIKDLTAISSRTDHKPVLSRYGVHVRPNVNIFTVTITAIKHD